MSWCAKALNWLDPWLPSRRVKLLDGEVLPTTLPWRNLVLLRDRGNDWSIGMRCPCGCDEPIELALFPEASTRWTLKLDVDGRPTLHPSVWRRTGCCSHFLVRNGRVDWVREA